MCEVCKRSLEWQQCQDAYIMAQARVERARTDEQRSAAQQEVYQAYEARERVHEELMLRRFGKAA